MLGDEGLAVEDDEVLVVVVVFFLAFDVDEIALPLRPAFPMDTVVVDEGEVEVELLDEATPEVWVSVIVSVTSKGVFVVVPDEELEERLLVEELLGKLPLVDKDVPFEGSDELIGLVLMTGGGAYAELNGGYETLEVLELDGGAVE